MDINAIANGSPIRPHFKGHSEVAFLLKQLHRYYDLSWPKIANLPAINPPGLEKIPIATLVKISNTGVVPQKWRDHFLGVRAVDNRPRIAIHKEDMESAAETIVKHIKPESKIDELIAWIEVKRNEKNKS